MASRGTSRRRLSKPAQNPCCDASRGCHRLRRFPAAVLAQGPADCMRRRLLRPFTARQCVFTCMRGPPLVTQGAIRPSCIADRRFAYANLPRGVRPAMNVCVPQAPKGAVISKRLPRKLRPLRRVILVLTEVSSINTSRSGCAGILGMQYSNHSCRRCFTHARSRSVATSDFFCTYTQACAETVRWMRHGRQRQ